MPRLAYTPEEDAVIRAHAPDYDRLAGLLPRWSREALRRRATKIGAAPSAPHWSGAERDTLRRLYPDFKAIYAALPNRTRDAILWQAKSIGLGRGVKQGPSGPTTEWAPDEIALLSVWGAKIPGRTKHAIESARSRRGIMVDREAHRAAVEAKRQARASVKIARASVRRTPKPKPVKIERVIPLPPPPPAPPKPVSWKRKDNAVHPAIISAATRSPHGYDLLPTIARAVPREVWPHIRPLVIERVALDVIERRLPFAEIAAAMPQAVRAAMDLYLNPNREAA